MKQEIVIKVQMRCDKCRTKAMELVASADGVSSVSLAGDDRNHLVVVGDGVDAVSMASSLRKKVGPTDIIKVGEPNKNAKTEKKGDGDEKKEKEKEKSKDSGKEKVQKEKAEKKDGPEKGEIGKNAEQQYQHQYQYQYQQQGPKMEYAEVQQQWYPGYPAYPQIVVYDSASYSNPNCCIM